VSAGRIIAAGGEAIAEAADLIRAGGLVAFPTETVYGLGANATNARAVAAIFAAKNRPRFNPLICHVFDADQALQFAHLDERAEALVGRFWPGPLTLVLPRRSEAPLALLTTAGLDSVAVRAPDHPVARALIDACGAPLAAPSANRSGLLSPTRPEHVAAALGACVDLILDGGPCRIGLESTIIDLSGPRPVLLRPGGVPIEEIEAVIGDVGRVPETTAEPVRAPGMLSRHYAPDRPLRLDARTKRSGEALLGFGATAGADLNLSPAGILEEAAANLFAMLRALDRPDVAAIAVAPIPQAGLGLAINDRLRRAAAPAGAAREVVDRGEGGNWSDGRGPAAPCVLPDEADDAP
jgi:L-threonylcarbamoyladenylate synthase